MSIASCLHHRVFHMAGPEPSPLCSSSVPQATWCLVLFTAAGLLFALPLRKGSAHKWIFRKTGSPTWFCPPVSEASSRQLLAELDSYSLLSDPLSSAPFVLTSQVIPLPSIRLLWVQNN